MRKLKSFYLLDQLERGCAVFSFTFTTVYFAARATMTGCDSYKRCFAECDLAKQFGSR